MNYVGFFISMVTFLVIYALVLKKFGLEKTKSENIINKAKQTGCIVVASLKDVKFRPASPTDVGDWSVREDIRKDTYKGIYEYIVNNRTYRYVNEWYNYPNSQITLYYNDKNPVQAYENGSKKNKGFKFIVFNVIIPFIVFILLGKVFHIVQI